MPPPAGAPTIAWGGSPSEVFLRNEPRRLQIPQRLRRVLRSRPATPSDPLRVGQVQFVPAFQTWDLLVGLTVPVWGERFQWEPFGAINNLANFTPFGQQYADGSEVVHSGTNPTLAAFREPGRTWKAGFILRFGKQPMFKVTCFLLLAGLLPAQTDPSYRIYRGNGNPATLEEIAMKSNWPCAHTPRRHRHRARGSRYRTRETVTLAAFTSARSCADSCGFTRPSARRPARRPPRARISPPPLAVITQSLRILPVFVSAEP